MSLRTRLIILLSAFAVFALAAASATIYGVRLYVEDAIVDFQSCMDQTREVDHLRLAAREQMGRLREIVGGRGESSEAYLAERDDFFTRLEQVARYQPTVIGPAAESEWTEVLRLAPAIKSEFQACVTLALAGDRAAAAERFAARLENDLGPALETRLQIARTSIDNQRGGSVNSLVATNTQLLILAALIAALGAGLVVVGAALIRRWLILPVAELKSATERLGAGDMSFRVQLAAQDELGDLGASLNHMADSLVGAQQDLHTSETKFRSLFENLRDTVLICDADGRMIEHHDGDLKLLQSAGDDWRGRHLSEYWSRWFSGEPTWSSLLEKVWVQDRPTLAADLEFGPREAGEEAGAAVRVDLVAYRVEYGSGRYAAIVLREVTDRHELQRRARQAETMKATISFAQGIAHDFNNLLTSGMSTLSRLSTQLTESAARDQAGNAMEACRQAARLARRLLDFAGQDRGHPEMLQLNDAVTMILNSLDHDFFHHIRLRTECRNDVLVCMDRDQLTQVVLNLVHNAREAMPDSGELCITVEHVAAPATNEAANPRSYALLTVEDTGCGMGEEVKQKLFEPFFSTKPRVTGHRRGLGMAVVYAAVRNAGGHIELESRPGVGTRFSVFFPSDMSGSLAPAARFQPDATGGLADGGATPERASPPRAGDRRTGSA